MNSHEFPQPKKPEVPLTEAEKQEQEEREWMEVSAKQHPEYFAPEFTPEQRIDSGPERERFEKFIADFETLYSLDELHAITHLTFESAKEHPLRAPALEAYKIITRQFGIMRDQSDMTSEQIEEMEVKYKRIAQAIGIFNTKTGIVDHTR